VRSSPLSLSDRVDQKVFDVIYSRSLVYNTSWEDPAVDRQALDLKSDDTVLGSPAPAAMRSITRSPARNGSMRWMRIRARTRSSN
jgi:S-adenosylmethionine:diacylglycerol 3-amino-3-carboxypropyl transferase